MFYELFSCLRLRNLRKRKRITPDIGGGSGGGDVLHPMVTYVYEKRGVLSYRESRVWCYLGWPNYGDLTRICHGKEAA